MPEVKELQEEMNSLCSIQANKQDIDQLFSEMLQPQGSPGTPTSTAVEKLMDLMEHCRVICQGTTSQGSVKGEAWILGKGS